MIEKLDELIKNMEELAGSWNGKDEYFVSSHDGCGHTEDEAHQASDIVDTAKELKELIIGLEEM